MPPLPRTARDRAREWSSCTLIETASLDPRAPHTNVTSAPPIHRRQHRPLHCSARGHCSTYGHFIRTHTLATLQTLPQTTPCRPHLRSPCHPFRHSWLLPLNQLPNLLHAVRHLNWNLDQSILQHLALNRHSHFHILSSVLPLWQQAFSRPMQAALSHTHSPFCVFKAGACGGRAEAERVGKHKRPMHAPPWRAGGCLTSLARPRRGRR